MVTTADHTFEQTLSMVRTLLEESDLWIVGEIDPQKLARKAGFDMLSARQLLFFHPRYLKPLLELLPDALIEVPLKVTVLQKPDLTISVRFSDVRKSLAEYADLADLRDRLSALVVELKAKFVTRLATSPRAD